MITHCRKHVIPIFLALCLLLQGCAFPGGEQREPEPVTLKVALFPYISYAPFSIAEKEGYFAEQGIQIEFVQMGFANTTPALAQGELDVTAGFISAGTLNAMARGARLKIVADKGYIAPTGCASTALTARRALVEAGELENPAQLKGRRIVMDPATVEGYYVEKLLSTVGLTLEDIEIVDIPTPAELEALEKGTVDLTASSEPWVTRLVQAGHAVLWKPASALIPDFQFAFVLYGPTLLDESPDVGRRFMVAYFKAVRQYNQGKTERNLELLAEFTGLEQELLTQVCWPQFRDNGEINVQSVLDFQAWVVEKGYLDSPVTEEQFWDPSFVEYANEVLGASSQ